MRVFAGSLLARIAAAVAGLSGLITPTSRVRICTLPASTRGAGLLPELLAVGTEGIGKDIQHDRGVLATILQPVCAGHLLPHLLSRRGIEFFLKQLLAEVAAVLIIHIAGDRVFTIRR